MEYICQESDAEQNTQASDLISQNGFDAQLMNDSTKQSSEDRNQQNSLQNSQPWRPCIETLLQLQGPKTVIIQGKETVLPQPVYWIDCLQDKTFKPKVEEGLYLLKNVLFDVVDQKKYEYDLFNFENPQVFIQVNGKEVRVGLDYIQHKIMNDKTSFGSKDIMAELESMATHFDQIFPKDKKDLKLKEWQDLGAKTCIGTAKKYWKDLKKHLIEELEEAVSCPQCTMNYYVFDNSFIIPCQEGHSVSVLTTNTEKRVVKILPNTREDGKVRVALFKSFQKNIRKRNNETKQVDFGSNSNHHERKWVNKKNLSSLETNILFVAKLRHSQEVQSLQDYLLMLISRFGVRDFGQSDFDRLPLTSWTKETESGLTAIHFPWQEIQVLESPCRCKKRIKTRCKKSAAKKRNINQSISQEHLFFTEDSSKVTKQVLKETKIFKKRKTDKSFNEKFLGIRDESQRSLRDVEAAEDMPSQTRVQSSQSILDREDDCVTQVSSQIERCRPSYQIDGIPSTREEVIEILSQRQPRKTMTFTEYVDGELEDLTSIGIHGRNKKGFETVTRATQTEGLLSLGH